MCKSVLDVPFGARISLWTSQLPCLKWFSQCFLQTLFACQISVNEISYHVVSSTQVPKIEEYVNSLIGMNIYLVCGAFFCSKQYNLKA